MKERIMWHFDEEDSKIIFLLKTMKSKYVEDTLKTGAFCFNSPNCFISSNDLYPAQNDTLDSHLTSNVMQVQMFPILSKDANGIHYGDPKLVAAKAQIHEISTVSMHTPMCCFRRILEEDMVECENGSILKLGNLVDRIKNEFGHDSYILILRPGDLLDKIEKISSVFARRIHYGDINPEFQEFLDKCEFPQAEMFQKRIDYAWQKEFRIILPAQESTDPKIIQIGSIEDIAVSGYIDDLRKGLFIANEAYPITRAVTKI